MKNYPLQKIISLLVCLILQPLTAQEQAPRLSVKLLAFSLQKGAEKIVIEANEERSAEITLPTRYLSPKVKVKGRKLTLGVINGDGTMKALSQAKLPEQGQNFLLILTPGNAGYNSHVVSLDQGSFQENDTLFFNLAKVPVAGKLGPNKFAIAPGQMKIVQAPPAKKKRYYEVRFFYKENKTPHMFCDTRWPYQRQMRAYLFFYQKPNTKRLIYRAVDEYLGGEE